MTLYEIRSHIENRRFELVELEQFWDEFQEQNKHLSFDSSVFRHVQAKVSSKRAYLQKSINDHEKLAEKYNRNGGLKNAKHSDYD